MAVVSVFVSSTFRDFHLERDAIRSQVVPQLDAVLAPFGARVEMLDLRWGVDTTDPDEAHRRVLGVCLAEIERCRPLFVGLVGDRFGWVPRPDDLVKACEEAGVLADLPQDGRHGLSITALECWFGGLRSDSQAVFALRDRSTSLPGASSDTNRSGLDWLRATIVEAAERHPDRVSAFTFSQSVDELADRLVSVLTPMVVARARELVDAGLSPYQAAVEGRAQEWSIAVGRRAEVSGLRTILEDSAGPVGVVLTGQSGMGKSTVVNVVADEFAAGGWGVARVHLGIAPGSTSIPDVAALVGEQWGWHPLSRSGVDASPSTNDWLAWWARYLANAPRRTLVMLDGLEQFDAGTPRDLLPMLDGLALTGGVRFLLSTSDATHGRLLETRGFVVEPLGPLAPAAVRQAASQWALADGRRQLPAALLDRWSSEPRTGLWVRMAVAEMNGLRREHFERAEAAQDRGVAASEAIKQLVVAEGSALPASDIQLADRILDRAARAIGSEPESSLLLGALAVTRSGLTPSDLGAVAGLDTVTLTRARWALGSQLVARDRTGRVAFAHGVLREAARRRCEPGPDVHRRIAQVLQPVPGDLTEQLDRLWHALQSADADVEGDSLVRMSGAAAMPVLRALARADGENLLGTLEYWVRDPAPLDLTRREDDRGIEACLGAIWERELGELAVHLRRRLALTVAAHGAERPGGAALVAELKAAETFHQAMMVHGVAAFEEDPTATWTQALDAAEAVIAEDGRFHSEPRQALMRLRLAAARLEVAQVCFEDDDPRLLTAERGFWAAEARLKELIGTPRSQQDIAGPRAIVAAHAAAIGRGEQVDTAWWREAVEAARSLFRQDPGSRQVAADLVRLLGGAGWALADEGREIDAIDTWLEAAAVKIPFRHDAGTAVVRIGPRDSLAAWVMGVDDAEVGELLSGTLAPDRIQAVIVQSIAEYEAMIARAELALARARAATAGAYDLKFSILQACRQMVRALDRHPIPAAHLARAKACRIDAVRLRDSTLKPIVAEWNAALAAHRSANPPDRFQLVSVGTNAHVALWRAGFHRESSAVWLDRYEIAGTLIGFDSDKHPYRGLLRGVLSALPEEDEADHPPRPPCRSAPL